MRQFLGLALAVFVLGGSIPEIRFADKVLEGTRFVKDPEAALGDFDGKYAGVELHNGVLELGLTATNGEGNDIAVHAQRPQYGYLPETMNYGVFAKPEKAENWTFLGWGSGKQSPEFFDLGKLPAADRVMILFKDVNEIIRLGGIFRTHKEAYRMNIDAVVALH